MTTGAVAAYLRYYSGSLVPSIVLHVVHNGAIFLMAYLLS
jgi:membrane protease YdiL (CAAX protease family)